MEKKEKTYLEALDNIIEDEEEDISHLNDRMKEILYPKRYHPLFSITLIFPPDESPHYQEAINIAKKSPHYHTTDEGRFLRHYAKFDVSQIETLYQLHELLETFENSYEVLVNDKMLPYARGLWLPLMWLFLP
jgi:hypothetical protein